MGETHTDKCPLSILQQSEMDLIIKINNLLKNEDALRYLYSEEQVINFIKNNDLEKDDLCEFYDDELPTVPANITYLK